MITVISSDKSHNGPIMALDSDILTMYKQIPLYNYSEGKKVERKGRGGRTLRVSSDISCVLLVWGPISNTVTKKNFFEKGSDKQKENNL